MRDSCTSDGDGVSFVSITGRADRPGRTVVDPTRLRWCDAVRTLDASVRRAAAIVFVLIVLGPSVVRAATWYRCMHDDVARDACCCPAQAKHHDTPAPATELRQACCCRITTIAARESPVRGAPPLALATAPALPAVATLAILPPDVPVGVTTLDHLGEPRGPPGRLFARHCSLRL
jgi:hypothetical protein